ncbi:unnamed protein product [Rhizoctonia solani]|uniref:Deacetylase sirtuin-type domain-containing protein n=1 Tax=Rhizoctonia solani TaxID=456999 RepID=A0A8H2ZX83_9AGAM|nr:unnamed protein product [Rhizoctonia solani]
MSNATRGKLYSSLADSGRKSAQRVLEGVANSRCMIICGAGISVEAQIPDYRSPGGLMSSKFRIFNEKVAGKDVFANTDAAGGLHVKVLNYIMTSLRQHARVAPVTDFHRLIQTMLNTDRAVKCLTRNFDGLETRDQPNLATKVIELHGKNDTISCLSGHTISTNGEIIGYEDMFMQGDEVPCPTCSTSGRERSEGNKRLRNLNVVHLLRPGVYLDERFIPSMSSGEDSRNELCDLVASCQVLLIVGTSLATPHAFSLVMELERRIHESEGVVVFINTKDMSKGRLAHAVDYHIQLDAQECARYILNSIAQQNEFDVQRGKEIWLELSERELSGTSAEALEPLTIPVCCICSHPMEDVLLACTSCNRYFCFESPEHKLGRMCVSLDRFSPSQPIPFNERKSQFVCPECYDHEEGKMYPHFVAAPRFFHHSVESPKKLRVVMFHLGQFWPISEHLEGCIVSAWKAEGWATDYQFSGCEQKTYNTLVVYVTHALYNNGLYQLTDSIALGPQKFLDLTIKPIHGLIVNSCFSAAVILACGRTYQDIKNAQELEAWVKRANTFDSIVGMLNERLNPCYLASFVAKVSTQLLGYDHWDQQSVMDVWLRDTLACTHTDLVYFGKEEKAQIFLFSPMQSRPLGRELPSIHMTCKCVPGNDNRSRRKTWIVKHRSFQGMDLNHIDINIRCSQCRSSYDLRASDHQGTLVKIGGLYAALVPYFLSQ